MIKADTFQISVCGAGAMGAGIAQVAAQSGHKVVVYDQQPEALARAHTALLKTLKKLTSREKLSLREAAGIEERITWSSSINDLAQSRLVVEAIIEDAAIKQGLFKKIEDVVSEEAILATNTSSLSVSALGAGLKRPEKFLGLHFFNPAPIMKLVEIVPGRRTDVAHIDEMTGLMAAWRKVPVIAKDVPGFIVNRVARPFYGEGWRALEEGVAEAKVIDFLLRRCAGFRMGPLELGDLIGHDVNYAAAKSVYDSYYGRTRFRPALAQSQLVAAGDLGKKTGRGVYDENDEPFEPALGDLPDISEPITVLSVVGEMRTLGSVADAGLALGEGGPAGVAMIGDVRVELSTGRSAREAARREGRPVAVLDWASADASVAAFSASCEAAAKTASWVVQKLKRQPVQIEDRPGGVVYRTMLQLANCAADAVVDQVGTPAEIDKAMLYGVNYPVGPLAWASSVGIERVISALSTIAEETGDALYAPSEGLRRLEDIAV